MLPEKAHLSLSLLMRALVSWQACDRIPSSPALSMPERLCVQRRLMVRRATRVAPVAALALDGCSDRWRMMLETYVFVAAIM
jgi:hypothetical protein